MTFIFIVISFDVEPIRVHIVLCFQCYDMLFVLWVQYFNANTKIIRSNEVIRISILKKCNAHWIGGDTLSAVERAIRTTFVRGEIYPHPNSVKILSR